MSDLTEIQVHVVHVCTDGVEYVAMPAWWVQWATRRINTIPIPERIPGDVEVMQAKADEMKRLAAEGKFPNLHANAGSWWDEDGDEILFTPYGYRKVKEVQDELER